MSTLSDLVNVIRPANPNIAACFDEVERRLMILEGISPPPPPPGLPKPPLSSPLTLTVPSTGTEAFALTPGKDYIIKVQDRLRTGPLRFSGAARNVVFDPFEHIITDTTSTDYGRRRLLEFRDITGTIHLEGYYGHGVTLPSLTEGINIQCPQATLQILNSRIEGVKRMNANADPQHPDVIQTWSLNSLKIWNFTCSSDYQGFLTMAISGQVYPGTNGGEVLYHRVNCLVLPNAFTNAKQNVPFIFPLKRAQKFKIGDFYVAGAFNSSGQPMGVANAIYERANEPFVNGAATLWDYQLFRANGTAYQAPQTGKTTATWLGDMLTVNQDDYIQFINPTVDNLWNLDATAGARVKKGVPSGGDYQPAATTGRGYPA